MHEMQLQYDAMQRMESWDWKHRGFDEMNSRGQALTKANKMKTNQRTAAWSEKESRRSSVDDKVHPGQKFAPLSVVSSVS